MVTLDNAFVNTAACESAITFIDGEAGILRYRGIDIEDLVSGPSPSYLETAWLLIHGELPTQAQRDQFSLDIRKHTLVHEDVKSFFDGFPKDAHPMATLSSVVTAQSTFYTDSLDPQESRARAAVDRAPDGEAAHDRRVRVQEVDRPAVHLSRTTSSISSRTSSP